MTNCINPPKHQEHIMLATFGTIGYSCEDVIAMEKKFGPHIEGCKFVGMIAPTKCCKKEEK